MRRCGDAAVRRMRRRERCDGNGGMRAVRSGAAQRCSGAAGGRACDVALAPCPLAAPGAPLAPLAPPLPPSPPPSPPRAPSAEDGSCIPSTLRRAERRRSGDNHASAAARNAGGLRQRRGSPIRPILYRKARLIAGGGRRSGQEKAGGLAELRARDSVAPRRSAWIPRGQTAPPALVRAHVLSGGSCAPLCVLCCASSAFTAAGRLLGWLPRARARPDHLQTR